METPFYSVLIPTFNSEKTLEKAIDSILCQAYGNVEIVVIDGLSTDNTIGILNEFAKKDKRVRYISEKDRGIYDAMNKGIKLAMGQWLYFLGGDDYLLNCNVLGDIHTVAVKCECNFIYGNVFNQKYNGKYGKEFDEEEILFSNISHQAIFYRRELFTEIGNYNIQYKTLADWDFNIRCFFSSHVKRRYVNALIANFAKGGASTVSYDLFFFRDSLFPKNLRYLNERGVQKLYNIKYYDRWWRLIRSLRLSAKEDVDILAGEERVPRVIMKMVLFQRNVSYSLLRIGYISKPIMFVSYCLNIFSRKFD